MSGKIAKIYENYYTRRNLYSFYVKFPLKVDVLGFIYRIFKPRYNDPTTIYFHRHLAILIYKKNDDRRNEI